MTPQTAPSTPRLTGNDPPVESRPVSRTPEPAPPSTPKTVDRGSEVDMSFSTLADTSIETVSTQAEIQIGPQPLPYVYHRRAQTVSQHLAPVGDFLAHNQRYRQISSPALTIPHLPAMSLSTTTHAEPITHQSFSDWRQEQLKHMKQAKLVNEGKFKTLSSLHGPLSLPYARNPR